MAETALTLAKELFAREGSETDYQNWKRRKEKANEIQSVRELWNAP